MNKKRTALKNFLFRNQKADFTGENPEEYLAPEVSICDFAPEKGFALSMMTEDYGSSGTDNGTESYGNTDPDAANEGYGSISF